jgi:site-specific recombinase XerD
MRMTLAQTTALSAAAVPALANVTPWPVAVAAYLDAAIDSPHTRRAYQRHLQAAFSWLDVPSVADITGAQLAAYRDQLTGNCLAPASQSQALAALRSFLHWAGTVGTHRFSGDVMRAALKTPRGSTKQPYQVLSEPEGGGPARGGDDAAATSPCWR